MWESYSEKQLTSAVIPNFRPMIVPQFSALSSIPRGIYFARPFRPCTIKVFGEKPGNTREFQSPPRAESMFAEGEVAWEREPKSRNSLTTKGALMSINILISQLAGQQGAGAAAPAKYSDDQKLRIVDDARHTSKRRELHRRRSAHTIRIIEQRPRARIVDDPVIRIRRRCAGFEGTSSQGAR